MRMACLLVAALAACGSKDEAKPTPKSRVTVDATIATATIDATAAIDAATGPRGTPVDLAALPELGAHGPDGTQQIHAADAPLGYVRNAMAALGRANLIEPSSDVLVTGRIGPTTEEHIRSQLVIVDAEHVKAQTKGVRIDISFHGASAENLFRFFANILRESIVVAPQTALPAVDIRVRWMPTAQALAVVTERLGLVAERHGTLHWVRSPGGAELDPALLHRKGPKQVDVDARDARAGEIYAMLSELGAVDGGAPCDAGPPVTLRMKKVPIGTALAVIAAVSGQRPGDAVCPPTSPASLDDVTLVGVVRIGDRRAAVVRAGGAAGVITRGDEIAGVMVAEIGDGLVTTKRGTDSRVLLLYPDDAIESSGTTLPDLQARIIEVVATGRLALTQISRANEVALFETADGGWYSVSDFDLRRFDRDAKIEPGKVVLSTGEAVMRRR